jgi:DNA repair protein RAD50
MVVARSMEVSQKKTSASFKALDGTIRTVNRETGERVTLSHKCTELDNSIPTYLGVSKPILEHVMFCHQEDSSWPLQEGAVLKKRFGKSAFFFIVHISLFIILLKPSLDVIR